VKRLLPEWTADWKLAGKSATTIHNYILEVAPLLATVEQPRDLTLGQIKTWISEAPTPNAARYRGRAARAFFSTLVATTILFVLLVLPGFVLLYPRSEEPAARRRRRLTHRDRWRPTAHARDRPVRMMRIPAASV